MKVNTRKRNKITNFCIPRRSLHYFRICRLNTQALCRRSVHNNIDPQDLHRVERVGRVHQRGERDQRERGNARAHLEADKVPDVVENGLALLHSGQDGGEVVVEQDDVAGLFADVGAGQAHGDADVGAFDRHAVVDAVPGHGNNKPMALKKSH
jgi:hypothetical protein